MNVSNRMGWLDEQKGHVDTISYGRPLYNESLHQQMELPNIFRSSRLRHLPWARCTGRSPWHGACIDPCRLQVTSKSPQCWRRRENDPQHCLWAAAPCVQVSLIQVCCAHAEKLMWVLLACNVCRDYRTWFRRLLPRIKSVIAIGSHATSLSSCRIVIVSAMLDWSFYSSSLVLHDASAVLGCEFPSLSMSFTTIQTLNYEKWKAH